VLRTAEALAATRAKLTEEMKTPLQTTGKAIRDDPVRTQLRQSYSVAVANLNRAQKRYDSLGADLKRETRSTLPFLPSNANWAS